jgi:hypothetical protein
MKRFDDVQFFGSYCVVDFVAGARAQSGEPKRTFAYAAGEVHANFGEQTPEEAKLRFANLEGLSPSAARDRINKNAEEHEAEKSALVASGLSPGEARARVRQGRSDAFPGFLWAGSFDAKPSPTVRPSSIFTTSQKRTTYAPR